MDFEWQRAERRDWRAAGFGCSDAGASGRLYRDGFECRRIGRRRWLSTDGEKRRAAIADGFFGRRRSSRWHRWRFERIRGGRAAAEISVVQRWRGARWADWFVAGSFESA